MAQNWLEYRERGSVFAYRLIAWIARTFGRRLTRLLLYPICLYYILLSRTTPRASREYLARIHGRPARWGEMFRHHYDFSAVFLDRAYLYAGQYARFDITAHGLEMFETIRASGRGCLMLSAHMGSFEIMRAFAVQNRFTVNMMMYEDNAQKITAALAGMDTQPRRIIPIGRFDALLTAKERLDQGELVGILADRAVGSDRLVPAPFLGATAHFPAGPFLAAAALDVPVILFFCLYRGGNRYELFFEKLADRLTLNRRNPAELEPWVRQFAGRLEHYCRLAPYNWFNFYDFWAPPRPESPAET